VHLLLPAAHTQIILSHNVWPLLPKILLQESHQKRSKFAPVGIDYVSSGGLLVVGVCVSGVLSGMCCVSEWVSEWNDWSGMAVVGCLPAEESSSF